LTDLENKEDIKTNVFVGLREVNENNNNDEASSEDNSALDGNYDDYDEAEDVEDIISDVERDMGGWRDVSKERGYSPISKPIEDSPTKIVESIGEPIDIVMG
jgi:hypothetical protein